MKRQKRIAIAAERSSAYGRDFICGVAEIAEQHPEWDLVLVDPRGLTRPNDCSARLLSR